MKSNKEDTGEVVAQLGEVWDLYTQIKSELDSINVQLTYYKKMYVSGTVAGLVSGTAFGAGATLFTVGLVQEINGTTNNLWKIGGCVAIGATITYCGGKFIFKWW